jgi:menaquinone-dependent protoporphyrinogen oxidase
MKVLVTVASKHGSTAEIAKEIASVLNETEIDAVVTPPEEVQAIDEYDPVVLGSAVYAGHWMKEAKELVDRHGDALAERPVWLLSSGPIGDPPKPEEDPVDVASVLERTGAREHRVFAGKLVKKGLSFGEKAIVLALRAPEGDFRDWDEIRSWAGEIADAIQKQGSKEAR